MRNHGFGWGFALFAMFSALYGVAGAEGLQQQVHLSPQEELAQADASIAKMNLTANTVRRALEQSHGQRDVVKSLCLNDKLNQIDVAVRSAQDRRATLDQAIMRKDAEQANHEFTILTVLRHRVEALDIEARQCLGEELQFLGVTKVITTIESGMPSGETAAYPEVPVVVSPPAVCDSCFR